MRARSVEYGDWGGKSPSSCNSGVLMSIVAGAAGPRTGPASGAMSGSEGVWMEVSLFGISNKSLEAFCFEVEESYLLCHSWERQTIAVWEQLPAALLHHHYFRS